MSRIEIPWPVQLGVVAASYAAVLTYAAAAIATRYWAGLKHPDDFNGGMAAFGDWMLDIFIGCLLLIPTFFLAFVIRERQTIFEAFAKILFAFSLTAPVSLGLMFVPAVSQRDTWLGSFCLYRLFGSPAVILWFGASRLFARFKLAKRLTSSALAIEFITMLLMVGSLFFSERIARG